MPKRTTELSTSGLPSMDGLRTSFHPVVSRWFEQRFGSPTDAQRLGWPAILSGGDTLIAAPTGTGKTLAAFMAAIDSLFQQGLARKLRDETQVVYVSPLKALGNDIHKNLDDPLSGIRQSFHDELGRDIEVRSAVRTGDTSSSARQAILRKPPHLLVTTPESFYLMLTSESGRRLLRTVRVVITDEIHAVVSNRRGSHLALSLERLTALAEHPVQRIGLSATQKPIEEVAAFLVGNHHGSPRRQPRIIDCGQLRKLDLAIELPSSPLEAVMSNEVWTEVYKRLVELIQSHRTTLIFVNTRRLAERMAYELGQRLGGDVVMPHHGSLSAKLRLDAENRLKRGELRALVATASLELGIDIGSVDLVCQIGPTRSIATLLQRVGRAEHRRGGLPKGRLFPLSRDELVETAATLRSVFRGDLDRLHIPRAPLDVLAQQIVACVACEEWEEDTLYELVRGAYPYSELARNTFDDVVRMLSEGWSTRKGRRSALVHRDAVNRRLRARRGSRLLALTSGGAIPDTSDYRVLLEPTETFIGTVNEDFAVESLAGDIFQLGNTSWKILRINSGTVRVEDAHGQPPGIPFWFGEAPGRTDELSESVSELRRELEQQLASPDAGTTTAWLEKNANLPPAGAQQLAAYHEAIYKALGVLPSHATVVLERFFDESGGMQVVLHASFGSRINRAWGLALRKRFSALFNTDLQAAATDDAIVLSLGTQHSFPLEDVFGYLSSATVKDLLIQAVLDAPMFTVRWRWNATRSLALPRHRGGKRMPAPLQRMEAENLLSAIFPEYVAASADARGHRDIPEHPLIQQTIDDCLTEAMDVQGLTRILQQIETGGIRCVARDLPEPSPLAHEIINSRVYTFLDNAPLAERQTRAVYLRRSSESVSDAELGVLDSAAIEKVKDELWPRATSADELHEALMLTGVLSDQELRSLAGDSPEWIEQLLTDHRIAQGSSGFWFAAERLDVVEAVYGSAPLRIRHPGTDRTWTRPNAIRELVRGRVEVSGPVTAATIASYFRVERTEIDAAFVALEQEGAVLRGRFRPNANETEWCDRRVLARIHRLTLNRLRAEIQPVSIAEFQRFLAGWQHLDSLHQLEGPEGVTAVLDLLDGYELPAAAWERHVLSARIRDYDPAWLDRLCFTGRVGWGRITRTSAASTGAAPGGPIRTSPISIFSRESLPLWTALSEGGDTRDMPSDTEQVWHTLAAQGALFFSELVKQSGVLPTKVEQALAELVSRGCVTADSFEGLRALLLPENKRVHFTTNTRSRHRKPITSVEQAGRWTCLRTHGNTATGPAATPGGATAAAPEDREPAIEHLARILLRRYGVVFRRMIEREPFPVSWFELVRVYRRLEARGEVRGGYFVAGVSGEQYAAPDAISVMRALRKTAAPGELVAISAADPLNLTGILSPGARIPSISSHRILLRDGLPVAALRGAEFVLLDADSAADRPRFEAALRVGKLAPALRRYYA